MCLENNVFLLCSADGAIESLENLSSWMCRRLVCYKLSGFGETFCLHLHVDTSENKDGNSRFHRNITEFIPG